MKFEVIASSSKGNAYRIRSGRSTLLLEAGIDYKQLQVAFNFELMDIDGVLITHEHQDHAKSVGELIDKGVDVYLSKGTKEALHLKDYEGITVKALEQIEIGEFTVLPFEAMHDANEPLSFLIADKQGNKLLFVTDTFYIPYKFKGLTHIAVECNYSEELLEENIVKGNTPIVLRKRLLRSHFSLENVKAFIRENDLSKVKEIHLLHLSDSNSDEDLFKDEIQRLTGLPTYIARS